jgi:hypothetical protein
MVSDDLLAIAIGMRHHYDLMPQPHEALR